MNLIGRLEIISDRYCALTELRREQVSYRVFADQRRLGLVISGGAGMTVANYEKAMLWFAANWPEGVAWPEGVERPEFAEAESAAPAEQAVA